MENQEQPKRGRPPKITDGATRNADEFHPEGSQNVYEPPKDKSITHPPLPEGKNLYDKWRGSWKALKIITNPFDGKKIVLKWVFERMGMQPNKTGIPLEEHHVKTFNESRRIRAANVPTEQLYPAGTTDDIFDELPNPFEAVNL